MKKTKWRRFIINIIRIFIISFISIIIYQIYMETYNIAKNDEEQKQTVSTEETLEKKDISKIIEDVSENVVGISKIKSIDSTAFLINSSEILELGTGIIISKQGYILTNQHVVGEEKNCYILLSSGENVQGSIIWRDSEMDLAIIKIENKFNNVAQLGDSGTISVGENVYAIGNPIGYEFQRTVTAGIISAVNRTVKIKNSDDSYSYMSNLIQTDATINFGNSGGPLINVNGEIIGINTVKITSAEGIGFAVPINIIKPIIQKLEQNGKFEEPYLGIYAYDNGIISVSNKEKAKVGGVYISEIVKDGPADKTELKEGDIIIQVDNTNINKMIELQEYIYKKEPEDEIELKIKRGEETKNIKIILGYK